VIIPTVGRAASGARLQGDDFQHLVVWYHVLTSQRADSRIASIAVEAADAGNADDLVVTNDDRSRHFYQAKASVDASTPLNEEWLFKSTEKQQSLLQRLQQTWKTLKIGGQSTKIVLATTKNIDPQDRVLARRATIDGTLNDTLRSPNFDDDRARWASHLGVSEEELLEFLDDLELSTGQSEKAWRDKVVDAAHAAGVRADNDAIARGIQEVRDWIKRPRQVFTRAQIRRLLDELQLTDPQAARLLVVQALEHNPRAARAAYSTDWVDLFEGNDARNRRVLRDTRNASIIKHGLEQARQRLRDEGIITLQVEGPMRLPLWFTVGTELGVTTGFTLCAQAGQDIWFSSATPGVGVDSAAVELVGGQGGDQAEAVVSVNVSYDIRQDVTDYAKTHLPAATRINFTMPKPGATAVLNAGHAVQIATQIRDEMRGQHRSLRLTRVHLFLSSPSALVLFLGRLWDRMPPTTVYWDLGEPDSYEAAFEIVN
jgi:hypothetical protein